MDVNALTLHWVLLIVTVIIFTVIVLKKSRWREV
jgi:hypothetical protein